MKNFALQDIAKALNTTGESILINAYCSFYLKINYAKTDSKPGTSYFDVSYKLDIYTYHVW